MSDMKCPFCQQELREIYCYGIVMGYLCPNLDCKKAEKLKGNAEFWQELIRTRKALDIARHTIGWINQIIDGHADKQAIKIKCEYALDEITAAEQKDVK